MKIHIKKWRYWVFPACLVLIISIVIYKGINEKYKEIECQIKLKCIYSSLVAYYDEYKQLPAYNEWYDLLMKKGDLSADVFRCPSFTKKAVGSYVINEKHNVFGVTSPSNTVLVFEGDLGWNQFGGMEQITERHRGGSFVLFSNGDIKFVHKDDYSSLQWGEDDIEN
jgi:hypothetical protein